MDRRFRVETLALVLCLSCTVALLCEAKPHVAKVEIRDISAPGSPLVISGTVTITETLSPDGTVHVSTSQNVVAKNISNKTILTLVVKLEVTPPYGGPQEYTREYECFFASDVIRPGDTHDLLQRGPTHLEPYNLNEPAKPAEAEITVLYVQFLDGSVFGHRMFADHILSLRRIAWRHLKRLDRAYSRQGEERFLEELNETVEPGGVEVLIENVRETQRRLGTEAAVSQIRNMLSFAEEHRASFTASKT